MIPSNINHIIYNTGRNERISIKDMRLPPYDKIALEWIINQAQTPEGIDINENIILKIHKETYRYAATFACGTYASNEIFLISTGANTKEAWDGLWKRLHVSVGPKYHATTPLKQKPAGPMVIDIMVPCSRPEALAYLHSTDCYDFCTKLGRALLYPECLRI